MIIGIDLGTTNSLVAVWRDGAAQLVPNVMGQFLTPSVVGLDEEGRILVGQAARERLLMYPTRTTATFKRYMGSNREVQLGDRVFRAEELSAFVLKSLKEDAERFLNAPVTEAVITVPAYFSDAQRKATRIAGELAGLKVERLLNEPTAAALAYGLNDAAAESTFLIFDFGGGTFDVSILELFEGVMEVRASAGDNFLGGEDFLDLLIAGFYTEVGGEIPAGDRDLPPLRARLRREAERVKRRLSEADTETFTLDWADKHYEWPVNEEKFARLAAPLLERLRMPIERALRDARIRAADLDQVVLAGGSTRMPLIRKLSARLFGRLPAMHINPDEVVARGAAVQAGLKMRDAALNEIVMTDVCPYTLGTDVSQRIGQTEFQHGVFLPIIERNAVVPVSREKSVVTMHDNQKLVNVGIYQGEARMVKDNVFLGEIEIPVPAKPAGEVELIIRFTYDVNGLLEAEMVVAGSQEKHRLVIEKNPGVLSAEEIATRLAALQAIKTHPREHLPNTSLLARGERVYEQALGDARAWVGEQLLIFQRVLETQNEPDIAKARVVLSNALDEVEGESWL